MSEKDPAYPPEQQGYQPSYGQAPPPADYQQAPPPGYPQQQPGYPQQQPGYPPQQQPGYPPQQPGYPPQQQGYPPPGQQGYAPPAYAPGQQAPPPGVQYNPSAPTQTVIVRTTQGQAPNNYLALAIFVTLCCCLPFGICGIVYAVEVNDKWSRGDQQGAQESAASAKKWSYIGLITGIILIVIIVIFFVVYYVLVIAVVLNSVSNDGRLLYESNDYNSNY